MIHYFQSYVCPSELHCVKFPVPMNFFCQFKYHRKYFSNEYLVLGTPQVISGNNNFVIKNTELVEMVEATTKIEDKDKKEVFESHLFLQLYLMPFVHPHGGAG